MPARQNFWNALINAFNGMKYFFLHERNGKIQIIISFFVFLAGLFFHITTSEWTVVLFCIALVIGLEMLNAAIEKICDMVHPEIHLAIKITKDVAAAAVLWAAIISAVIGAIIFLPKILALL